MGRGSSGVLLSACAQSEERRAWYLLFSTFERARRAISGGERSRYEVAFAAATAGIAAELRGDLDRIIFHQLRNAAGIQPQTELSARRADEDDAVVVPEETPDLALEACVSEWRWVLDLLAPPGLFWSPEADWEYADLTRVALESSGSPTAFRALRDLGLTL